MPKMRIISIESGIVSEILAGGPTPAAKPALNEVKMLPYSASAPLVSPVYDNNHVRYTWEA